MSGSAYCGKVKVVMGHGWYERCGVPFGKEENIRQCKDCAAIDKALAVTWACTPRDSYYLLTCRLGDLELFEIIERQRWARAIDRVMIFKRAIGTMQRTMHNVISAGIE